LTVQQKKIQCPTYHRIFSQKTIIKTHDFVAIIKELEQRFQADDIIFKCRWGYLPSNVVAPKVGCACIYDKLELFGSSLLIGPMARTLALIRLSSCPRLTMHS
jgi:hypothetical protein